MLHGSKVKFLFLMTIIGFDSFSHPFNALINCLDIMLSYSLRWSGSHMRHKKNKNSWFVQIEVVKLYGITNISQQEYDVTFSLKAMKTSNPNLIQTFDHAPLKTSLTSSPPSHLSFVSIIVGAFPMASRRLFPPIGVSGPLPPTLVVAPQ